jgi:hypothetical protein
VSVIETDYLVIGAGAAGIGAHLDDPLMKSALARLFTNIEPAIAKLETFGPISRSGAAGSPASGS